MFDIAHDVHRWLADGQDVALARVVAASGLGSSATTQAVARSGAGEVAGSLLDSAADEQVAAALREVTGAGPRLMDVVISDQQAVDAGLVCGGRAQLIVQSATEVPEAAWDLLRRREPICLVTDLDGPALGRTTWFTLATTEDGPDRLTRHTPDVQRLFGRGATLTATTQSSTGGAVLVDALWPTPRLVVIGDGLLAEALERLGALLDWQVRVCTAVADGVAAVSELTRGDAVVVLSHDRDVDGPVLQAALTGRTGYVAGLGSRRTQAARRGWLRDRGVPDDVAARVHGPAGLDIGARTPAETALSILSEALAVRTGTDARPLRERGGPVHADGLNTPPPRYAVPSPSLP